MKTPNEYAYAHLCTHARTNSRTHIERNRCRRRTNAQTQSVCALLCCRNSIAYESYVLWAHVLNVSADAHQLFAVFFVPLFHCSDAPIVLVEQKIYNYRTNTHTHVHVQSLYALHINNMRSRTMIINIMRVSVTFNHKHSAHTIRSRGSRPFVHFRCALTYTHTCTHACWPQFIFK